MGQDFHDRFLSPVKGEGNFLVYLLDNGDWVYYNQYQKIEDAFPEIAKLMTTSMYDEVRIEFNYTL